MPSALASGRLGHAGSLANLLDMMRKVSWRLHGWEKQLQRKEQKLPQMPPPLQSLVTAQLGLSRDPCSAAAPRTEATEPREP